MTDRKRPDPGGRRTRRPPDKASPTESVPSPPIPRKRRATEDGDSLDVEHRPISRPVTPTPSESSVAYEHINTPKARTRSRTADPFSGPDPQEDDLSDSSRAQVEEDLNEEELRIEMIKLKLQDARKALWQAKASPVWTKLDFISPWILDIIDIAGPVDNNNTDKKVIANLAETNAYLTRKIAELELNNNNNNRPEPNQTRKQEQEGRTPLPPAQPSWAQVAAKAHQTTTSRPAKPAAKEPPTLSQDKTADPRCLIIHVSPPIPATDRPNGIEVRNRINDMLEKKGLPHYFRIMAVGYSVAGNIKITTTHACRATDILTCSEEIAAIITKNKVISVLPDEDHYRVKINKIPTWYDAEKAMTISNIHQELTAFVPEYDRMKKWRPPKWLGSDELIQTKQFASIVLDLTSEKDRNALLNLKVVKLFNYNCTITPYENRTQVYQCGKCGMYSHATNSCTTPRCLTCGAKDHSTEDHPTDVHPRCINCKGDHSSLTKECNTRRIRMGLKPIPQKSEGTKKRAQTNNNPAQTAALNQKRKEKGKGKERTITRDSDESTGNIGLSNKDITTLLANSPSPSTQRENAAKIIQGQTIEKLTIKIPNRKVQATKQTARHDSAMEVEEPTQTSSQ